jgi:hypothetical protein
VGVAKTYMGVGGGHVEGMSGFTSQPFFAGSNS